MFFVSDSFLCKKSTKSDIICTLLNELVSCLWLSVANLKLSPIKTWFLTKYCPFFKFFENVKFFPLSSKCQSLTFGRQLPVPLEPDENEEKIEKPVAAPVSGIEGGEDRVIKLGEIEHGIPPLLRVILRLTTHQISGLFDTLSAIIDKNNKLLLRCGEWIFALLAAQGKV